MTAPDIQKDIVNSFAVEATKAIINEIGDEFFVVMADESQDISRKEQLACVLRFLNRKGQVIERFLGIEHVSDTTSSSLKMILEELFSKHGLCILRLRGQGYDGASNMRGEFNGLKALILRQNGSAYYVHSFAHQLQLALIAIAKNHAQIASLFSLVNNVVNVVGASCKCRDHLQETQFAKIIQALQNDELQLGRGLNQETSLRRAGDTRWGSHYDTLISSVIMFSSVIDVLEIITEDGINSQQKAEASALLALLQSFDFTLCLHLMRDILGITNELSEALQRKEQDIVNAMTLAEIARQRLQAIRENGWDSLFCETVTFCEKHDISVLDMDWIPRGRPHRHGGAKERTNLHHYRVELFYTVIDMQLQELNTRFTEVTTKLLICLSCLNAKEGFAAFEKEKLMCLATLYLVDFSASDHVKLDNQLETFIADMCSNDGFSDLKGIGELAEKLLQTKNDGTYPLVYKLLKLALVLPVATATVERAFSVMNIIKKSIAQSMGDEWIYLGHIYREGCV